ncbi:UDP-glycosyltransferase UGT5-like [Rhynchophorus ferrugineus]|uniref:UDP-glycosyltransferase UGT5-like n=1 Tax=Rhynchophorus ferrugineus TaxID=354439 RepID=UPI003FCECCF0
MSLASLSILTLFILELQCGESARILGVFPLAGKSMNILYNRLMKGLADAGHDVTSISSYENKLPIVNGSYTDVILTGFAEDYEALLDRGRFLDAHEYYPISTVNDYFNYVLFIWNNTFRHPNVRKMLNTSQKFDLVLTEHLWNDCMEIFAHIYDCPVVMFTSMGGVNPWVNDRVGNYLQASSAAHFFMLGDYSKGMTFIERIQNLAYYLYDYYHKYFVIIPSNNAILQDNFPNPPDVSTFDEKVSIVLRGSHSSLRQPIPLAPNTVEIGGFHIDPPKKLPKDLQTILDGAKNGIIFFSMGSHVKSRDFSEEKRRIFLNVFKKLDQIVLWKFEDDNLPGKPDNVHIRKWLPQMDILAHPNIRLFITHGGYGSLQETIYHGVPVLTIPCFLDQYNNAYLAVQLGYALKLSYNDKNFNEDTLYGLIQELLNNPQYRENAKTRSRLFHDRPMKPLDTAIYWIEYAIRNKGAPHLKLSTLDIPFYKLYNIDIYLFFIVSVFIGYKALLYIVQCFADSLKKNECKIKSH